MAKDETLPLGVDHKRYIRNFSDTESSRTWREFSDAFWNGDSVGGGHKAEFLFRRGFLRDRWVLYGLESGCDIEDYMSDFQALQINTANGIYANVLQDRLLLIHTLAGYTTVPKVHALRGLGSDEVSLSAEWQGHRTAGEGPDLAVRIQPLLAGMRGRSELVRVRAGGFEGFGKSGDLSRLSMIVRDWSRSASVPYLFTEEQPRGRFMSGFFPEAGNLLSVILVRDLETWDPVLVSATLRCGARRGGGRLEMTLGGISAKIDIETGLIGPGAQLGEDHVLRFHDRHPDSGATFTGTPVPGWSGIRDRLLRIMDESSYMRVALLDFTLLDDSSQGSGLGLIGPSQLDLGSVQIHQPLLRHPVFAATMRKLGRGA